MTKVQKILTIAGMHRSGTSLTAMWLEGCGLDLGRNLMEGQFDNPQGYFEDLDVLQIHEGDLNRKGLKTNGLYLKNQNSFGFDKISIREAESLLKRRAATCQWGWKEPRSTLYLNSWKKLIPELKVLAVVRPFNDVVNSLVRRTKYSFIQSKKYSILVRFAHLAIFPLYLQMEKQRYLDAWIKYNKAILNFKAAYPNDILLVDLSKMIKFDFELLRLLRSQFNFSLEKQPITKFYEKELLQESRRKTHFSSPIEHKAKLLEDQLFKICDII